MQISIKPRILPPVERLLQHRRPADVLRQLPLLYGICGRAQQAAAEAAFAAASATTVDTWTERRTRWRVLTEMFYEHCFRTLMIWPPLFGLPARPDILRALQVLLRTTSLDDELLILDKVEHELKVNILGMAADQWLMAETPVQWAAQTQSGSAVLPEVICTMLNGTGNWGASDEVPLLPAFDAETARNQLAPKFASEADFAAHPRWNGGPCETGPLARWQAHPALYKLRSQEGNTIRTRMLARVIEMAATPQLLRALLDDSAAPSLQSTTIDTGTGVAWVETARGRLVHWVELADDRDIRVSRYRVLAPTEWNFANDGACVRGLVGRQVRGPTQALADVTLMMNAIDPCVDFEVELQNA